MRLQIFPVQFLLTVLSAICLLSALFQSSNAADKNSNETYGKAEIPRFFASGSRPSKPLKPVKKIHFLTSVDFPPFNYFGSDGELAGFNIDMTAAICHELNIVCTIEAQQFDRLTKWLRNGSADAVVAGLDSQTSNATEFLFTKAYMRFPSRFITRMSAKIASHNAGLKGLRISVAANTAHAAFLEHYYPHAEIVAYPNAQLARKSLAKSDVDLHFGDGASLSFWLSGQLSENCCQFFGGPFLDSHFFGKSLKIAVAKERKHLLNALNYALYEIEQNGTFARLYLKHSRSVSFRNIPDLTSAKNVWLNINR